MTRASFQLAEQVPPLPLPSTSASPEAQPAGGFASFSWRPIMPSLSKMFGGWRSHNYESLNDSEYSASLPSSPRDSQPSDFKTRATIAAKRAGFFLIPSPIQKQLRPAEFKAERLYPTSWLDGLRGLASLIVFFCHYTENHHGHFTSNPYGWPPEDPIGSAAIQLPFVRMIFSGRPMVPIFFVISGFVLSLKSLKLARAHNYEALHTTLSSSVFRRALRLFLPTAASTFMVMTFIQLGWQERYKRLPTLGAQIWDWLNALWAITFSWRWDLLQWPPYDVHLWTIPIEMANSMLLFITLIGLSRCKVWVRLATVSGLMLYCLKCKHWAGFEFLGGSVVAEVGLIQAARAERNANKEANFSSMSDEEDLSSIPGMHVLKKTSQAWKQSSFRWIHLFWVVNVIFALWVGGWPNEHVTEVPGLKWLAANTMDPYFSDGGPEWAFPWYALGALQIVFACQQVPWMQRVFVTSPIQYLANISYALYLVHGPIMDVCAHRIMWYVWQLLGGFENCGQWGRMAAWFFGLVLLAIPTVWTADLFWRAVDVPSVSFAKWLEGKCIVKED